MFFVFCFAVSYPPMMELESWDGETGDHRVGREGNLWLTAVNWSGTERPIVVSEKLHDPWWKCCLWTEQQMTTVVNGRQLVRGRLCALFWVTKGIGGRTMNQKKKKTDLFFNRTLCCLFL